jgi:hypothetical protein
MRNYFTSILFFAIIVAGASALYAADQRFTGEWNIVLMTSGGNQKALPPTDPDNYALWEFRSDNSATVRMCVNGNCQEQVCTWEVESDELKITDSENGAVDLIKYTFEENGSRLMLEKDGVILTLVRRADGK